jgi:hypothetical protein
MIHDDTVPSTNYYYQVSQEISIYQGLLCALLKLQLQTGDGSIIFPFLSFVPLYKESEKLITEKES